MDGIASYSMSRNLFHHEKWEWNLLHFSQRWNLCSAVYHSYASIICNENYLYVFSFIDDPAVPDIEFLEVSTSTPIAWTPSSEKFYLERLGAQFAAIGTDYGIIYIQKHNLLNQLNYSRFLSFFTVFIAWCCYSYWLMNT